MKYHKILSITLTNGLALLIFGGILASCQKNTIQKSGYFSKIDGPSRMPASDVLSKFNAFQDPKQIFIYCQLHELKTQSCYKKHLDETLVKFEQKYPEITEENKRQLSEQFAYQNIQKNLQNITNSILMGIAPKINEMVENRSNFCLKNSKFYMHRCLHQYISKESMHVLNLYQAKNSNINGHEYLYLKNIIEDKFKEKLEARYKGIESTQKKTSLEGFRSRLQNIKSEMKKDLAWLEKSPNIAVAKDHCLQKILEEAYNEIQEFDQEEIKQFIVENACIDIVGMQKVLSLINQYTQEDFEKRLQKYQSSLLSLIKQSKCAELDDLIESRKCIDNKWDSYLEASFSKWSLDNDNAQYKDQKKHFFMRINNNASFIKRSISSEEDS